MKNRLTSIGMIAVLGLVVVALLGWGGKAFAQTPTPAAQPLAQAESTALPRTIAVTGSGRATLSPDIAYVTIGVHTQGSDAAEAVAANNKDAEALIAALRTFGIAANDIKTTNFSIYPQQRYDAQGQPTGEITYMVDNSVYVTVRDLEKVGDLLDAAVQAGANAINGIQFDVEDKTAALSGARGDAVANAQVLAAELAKAAGVELGEIVSINASTSSAIPLTYGRGGGMVEAADVASSVPVTGGEMILTVDINVVYAIR